MRWMTAANRAGKLAKGFRDDTGQGWGCRDVPGEFTIIVRRDKAAASGADHVDQRPGHRLGRASSAAQAFVRAVSQQQIAGDDAEIAQRGEKIRCFDFQFAGR
jgi:hypothetical protein